MNFTLVGSDPRFLYLKQRLEADGHALTADSGNILAPPAQHTGIPYYLDPQFNAENALLTAEAALSLLMRRSPDHIAGMRVLVAGYGRIGSRLADLLRGLGAEVTVAARSGEARSLARLRGHNSVDINNISGTFDAVLNTVPAPVLTGDYGKAVCLDLASAPGGWSDGTLAARCPGLPGLYAPRSAANLMAEAIYRVMEDRHHGTT